MSGQQHDPSPCYECREQPAELITGLFTMRGFCGDCTTAFMSEWSEQDFNVATIRRYGIEPKDHLAFYIEQRGKCAICKMAATERRLVIDHDHETGEVRGLLCSQCNSAIGLLQDETNILDLARRYLHHRHKRRGETTEGRKRREARHRWVMAGRIGDPP